MVSQPRLGSWKEISSYLGRSTSTCHRWEEELGLPVHRLDGTPIEDSYKPQTLTSSSDD